MNALPRKTDPMPNIASVLKAEITRVARREVRTEIDVLRKSNAQHRSAIASLRRQVDALQREVQRTNKQGVAPKQTTNAKAEVKAPQRRFSAFRLAAHRAKLGVSGEAYGKLVNIGGQTILNWEQGKARPSAQQIQQLAEARELSRPELLERLGMPSQS